MFLYFENICILTDTDTNTDTNNTNTNTKSTHGASTTTFVVLVMSNPTQVPYQAESHMLVQVM